MDTIFDVETIAECILIVTLLLIIGSIVNVEAMELGIILGFSAFF